MNNKIKLDLHTHPIEVLKEMMGIKGILDINKEVVLTIVKAVKSSGLDGIAITERNNFNHGWVVGLEFAEHFKKEDLLILPGIEMDYQGQHFLSIYIWDWCRREMPFFRGKEWFNILAHPGFYHPLVSQNLMEVDFDAVEGRSIHGDFSLADSISRQKNIPVIRSSDARRLEDIGQNYTELELK